MSASCSLDKLPCSVMNVPTLLVVRLNGEATGYDLSSPERRRYDLRTQDDWHKFRMISFNRRLQRLSLAAAAKPSLSPKHASTRDALRTRRAASKAKRAAKHKQKRAALKT